MRIKLLILLLLTIISWFILPQLTTLNVNAVHMLILFILTMFGIILDVCHPIAWILCIITTASLTKTVDISLCFSGFSNIVPWLLFAVLSLAKVLTNTTLGLRLAYLFMKYFGKNIIGLSYSIILTELFIAPVLPSNTARAASVGFPLIKSLTTCIATDKIGSYLTLLYSFANAMTSGMFLTAMISNALILDLVKPLNIQITWLSWFKYLFIPYIIVLLLIPIILMCVCNPNTSNLQQVQAMAADKYKELGKISKREKFILCSFLFMLLMWINSSLIPIITTTLLGLCVFIFTKNINIKDVLSDYSTFSSVFLLGFLISLVNCLVDVGTIQWLNNYVSQSISGYNITTAFIILTVTYYYAQYFFTGESSKIIALYGPFLLTGAALGIDNMMLAMTLAAFSSASDILAHYTSTVSLIMYSNGYVTLKKWVICGFITSIIFLSVWYMYMLCI